MMNVFSERLKMLRQEKGLGQIALAKELGVGKSSVSQWETGTSEPRMSSLIAMAKYFNVSIDYLVGLED